MGLALADTPGSGCRRLHGLGNLHQLPGLLCLVLLAVAFAFSTSTCLQSRAEPGGSGQCAGWALGKPHGHCIQLPQCGHSESYPGMWMGVWVWVRVLEVQEVQEREGNSH